MGQKKKVGARVDGDLWHAFKQFVKDRHGQVRGSLSDELEQAIQDRMDAERGPDRLQRIEEQTSHMNRQLSELADRIEADGGTSATARSAPARGGAEPSTRDPPAPNQPRSKKAAFVADVIRDRAPEQTFTRPAVRHVVNDTYSFNDEATDAMVDAVMRDLGAEPDPIDDEPSIAWGDTLEERWQEHKEQAADDADDALTALDDATPGDD